MASVFFNPWMLAALGAASIPLIIEWLFRRRKRQIELPTLRYLLDNQEQEKIRRQDRILLILRTVAIILLVMALARPLIQRGWIRSGRKRHVAIVLDGTASMNQQVDVTTAFGRAQKKAAGIIRGLPPGTTVTVCYLGDRAETAVEPTTDLHTAAAEIEALRAGSAAAPMSDAFNWVKSYLDNNKKLSDVELYVFSDFQKQTWQPKRRQELISRGLNELSGRSEIFMVDCGGAPQFNYLVTNLRPQEPVVSANMLVSFDVTVEARGKVPEGSEATVTLLVDGVNKGVQYARPTDHPDALTFEYRFPNPGEYLVEAVLEGDEHRVDNRRVYLCSVPESVRVLILDDEAGSPGSDSDLFARAISPPTRPGMDKVSHFAAKIIPPSQIAYENVESYAVIVLMATHGLSESMVSKLERRVAEGGALWAFMGPAVNIYDYNKLLFKEGKGLLGCRLIPGQATTQPAGGASSEPFPRFADSTHPALSHLSDLGDVKDAGVKEYIKLSNPTPGGQVVLKLSDGSPLLVEKSFGRGKVLVCATTAGLRWNYMPTVQAYGIMIQEMLRHLVGDPDHMVNLEVGDRFEQPVFVSERHILLRCPDGRKERLTPMKRGDTGDARFISFDQTSQHGLYRIEAIEEVVPRRRFVVNQSEREGDLIRLTEGDFKEAFSASDWAWVRPEAAVEEMAAKLHTVIEMAPALFWGLLGLLATESFLAWRFGRRRGEGTS